MHILQSIPAGPVDIGNSLFTASSTPLAHATSTPPPAATPLRSAAVATDAAGAATPVGGIGLPTPAGPMGRGVSLPPTPFALGSTTPGALASFVAPAWRNRTSNAAFKGRSPSSSRSVKTSADPAFQHDTAVITNYPCLSYACLHPLLDTFCSWICTLYIS